jgi:hypothetical protein
LAALAFDVWPPICLLLLAIFLLELPFEMQTREHFVLIPIEASSYVEDSIFFFVAQPGGAVIEF